MDANLGIGFLTATSSLALCWHPAVPVAVGSSKVVEQRALQDAVPSLGRDGQPAADAARRMRASDRSRPKIASAS